MNIHQPCESLYRGCFAFLAINASCNTTRHRSLREATYGQLVNPTDWVSHRLCVERGDDTGVTNVNLSSAESGLRLIHLAARWSFLRRESPKAQNARLEVRLVLSHRDRNDSVASTASRSTSRFYQEAPQAKPASETTRKTRHNVFERSAVRIVHAKEFASLGGVKTFDDFS